VRRNQWDPGIKRTPANPNNGDCDGSGRKGPGGRELNVDASDKLGPLPRR
jgi:hypothetical protein